MNEVIAERRLNNQCIANSMINKPEQVVQELVAMQAQEYMQAVWAIGLRTSSSTLADIEQAIAERKIVLTWALRGTIHFVPPEDVKWLIQLSASRVMGQGQKRLTQLGVDDQTLMRCREIIYEALKGHQQITRSDLLQLLEQVGINTTGQRGYTILWNLTYQGLICFGPKMGKQQTFVLLDEWVPEARELTLEESIAELALRYFTAHGPSTVQDFAWWSGITLTDARMGLEEVKGQLHFEQLNGSQYWMSREVSKTQMLEDSGVFLLPGFDEYILGYKDRSAVLSPEYTPMIVPGNNGVFLPTLVSGGKVKGLWKRTIKSKGIEFVITPFEYIGDKEEQVIIAAERYATFVGLPITKIKFD
ncbi:winged helix DNA-binding domain-containing protein [Paenibacillus segetis]|uniref:Winged helix DNA-binding domain-containing protein n=1 Tax=Paenibacillus segetis TaxID=1325360 RepID=A0ABQ1YGF8_9BACL|nr:winged helix DNA-binding domain-containing protein [Paenibacillus segetis]GGH23646.1 hypothetical protein GCM10008013_22910 [Paenibacillus segetis]